MKFISWLETCWVGLMLANLLNTNRFVLPSFYGYVRLCSNWRCRVKGSSFTCPKQKTLVFRFPNQALPCKFPPDNVEYGVSTHKIL